MSSYIYTEMAPLPTDRMIDDPDPNRYDPDDYQTEDDDHSIAEDQSAHQPDRYEGEETTEGIEEALARL